MLNKRRGKNNTSFDCPMFRNKLFVMKNIWFRLSIPHGFTFVSKIRSFEEKTSKKLLEVSDKSRIWRYVGFAHENQQQDFDTIIDSMHRLQTFIHSSIQAKVSILQCGPGTKKEQSNDASTVSKHMATPDKGKNCKKQVNCLIIFVDWAVLAS